MLPVIYYLLSVTLMLLCLYTQLFPKFNKLHLCTSVDVARQAIDRLQANYDKSLYIWKEEADGRFTAGISSHPQKG